MEKSMRRFLMGLGIGSMLGAIAFRLSQTEKANELKKKMCCAAQSAADKAGEWMAGAKEKVSETAQKVADDVNHKVDDAKEKFHPYSGK